MNFILSELIKYWRVNESMDIPIEFSSLHDVSDVYDAEVDGVFNKMKEYFKDYNKRVY